MKTLTEIRNDLKEIRYYYTRKNDIDNSFRFTGTSALLDVVNLYNNQIRFAPLRLYDIYSSLYIENHTQESLAVKFGCSTENIQKSHKKLLEYLQKNIKDKENI